MPKQTQTSREDVINAGLKIIRENGIDEVNARAIAKILNTSVHPIVHHFKNMDELKGALFDEALEIYKSYVQKENDPDYTYRAMGISYIQFAKEQPNLFKLIFMNETEMTLNNFITQDKVYKYIENVISNETKMNKETILSFHQKMWFFTHGIATLVANKTCSLTDKEINDFLIQEFYALLKLEDFKKTEEWKNIEKYLEDEN